MTVKTDIFLRICKKKTVLLINNLQYFHNNLLFSTYVVIVYKLQS